MCIHRQRSSFYGSSHLVLSLYLSLSPSIAHTVLCPRILTLNYPLDFPGGDGEGGLCWARGGRGGGGEQGMFYRPIENFGVSLRLSGQLFNHGGPVSDVRGGVLGLRHSAIHLAHGLQHVVH